MPTGVSEMSKIGYLEGADPELLDRLALRGHQLVPLSDGRDGNGKSLAFLSVFDGIDLLTVKRNC